MAVRTSAAQHHYTGPWQPRRLLVQRHAAQRPLAEGNKTADQLEGCSTSARRRLHQRSVSKRRGDGEHRRLSHVTCVGEGEGCGELITHLLLMMPFRYTHPLWLIHSPKGCWKSWMEDWMEGKGRWRKHT